MVNSSSSASRSNVQFYDGQREALANIFGPNGVFNQFQQGKPNAGFDRAQANALQQLQRQQQASGIANTPLGTRQQADFLQKSTQAAGDDWMSNLFKFMQPAGQQSKSSSSSWGIL